jgi:transcriptional/translational regulatory protein YebC/TACO1
MILANGSEEDVMLVALDAGAEDIREGGDGILEVITGPSDLTAVRSALEAGGVEIESADVTQLPASTVPIEESDARKVLRLIDALDDLDDVQAVFSNYDIEDEIMEKVFSDV